MSDTEKVILYTILGGSVFAAVFMVYTWARFVLNLRKPIRIDDGDEPTVEIYVGPDMQVGLSSRGPEAGWAEQMRLRGNGHDA
jgi:hypothetical protein